MNNTPYMNKLAVELRILLEDPVAGGDDGIKAETNGRDFTAERINFYLVESIKDLVKRLVDNYGVSMASDLASGLIKTQAITYNTGGVSINKDFLYPVGLSGTDTYKYVNKLDIISDVDTYLIRVYTIEGNKLYVYIRENVGTPPVYQLNLQGSGTGTLYYLKADRVSSSTGKIVEPNYGTDTTLDMRWHDWVLRRAAQHGCEDKGTEVWLAKSQIFKKSAEEILK